jgi:hypothetical protein
MQTIIKKTAIICAAGAALCFIPYSMQVSKTGLAISADRAEAVIGRPATPGSVAGVARRSGRRAVRRNYYGHHY